MGFLVVGGRVGLRVGFIVVGCRVGGCVGVKIVGDEVGARVPNRIDIVALAGAVFKFMAVTTIVRDRALPLNRGMVCTPPLLSFAKR